MLCLMLKELESDIRHITKCGFSIDLVRVGGEGAVNWLWFETKLASIGTTLYIIIRLKTMKENKKYATRTPGCMHVNWV